MPSPKASQPKTTATKPADAGAIDTKLVRNLADILKDTGLTEIEVSQGELKIRVSRTAAVVAPAVSYAVPPAETAPPAATSSPPVAAPAAVDSIKSPMVGTVFLQPQPGSPKFVKVGDEVTEGQTLLIIEAMKTMNPIPAPKAGKVTQILVADGQAVEFGEPLVVLG